MGAYSRHDRAGVIADRESATTPFSPASPSAAVSFARTLSGRQQCSPGAP